MAVHIFGIRHHGVGSAKHIREELARLKPDIVLVEGPPEITSVFSSVGHADLAPPVAIMVYNSENPKQSTFYPFAEYSPEWIAIEYANKQNVPVRAFDLPAAISFLRKQDVLKTITVEQDAKNESVADVREPLGYLAEAAGFKSGEEWWDYQFEQEKKIDEEHFSAVMHAIDALRHANVESSLDKENIIREAYMRNIIRQAQNEMYSTIAVVCGAWHAPALVDLDSTAKADAKLIKELPKSKIKITCTWIPWTNGRLSMFSGYGAGIYSPGWYEHQWKHPEQLEIKWLTKVAITFRNKGMDISTAHVIEAFHLARALAVLRNKPFVTLDELNEATLSVMCMGDAILLQLIKDKLIVGEKLGKVPSDIPKVPLQEDFEQQVKSFRLKLTAIPKQFDLDLRKENDLQRSIFFHRLEILDIPWTRRTSSSTKGTFKESWMAEWQPEMMVALIDKAFYGNTVETAAQAVIVKQCIESVKVSEIAALIQQSIPAELYEQLDQLLNKINELSSVSADVIDLMNAIPALVDVTRYGSVRRSDLSILNNILRQLLTKVFIGLPNACYGLDEENSVNMFRLINRVNNSVRLYEDAEIEAAWYDTLHKLIDKQGVHHIILGCICRLLLDAKQLDEKEADRRISFALSPANDPMHVASWLEGFLSGNGMILIYDNRLWMLLYSWVKTLPDNVFSELLPLLRRAFSQFEFGERRQIGEKAKKGLAAAPAESKSSDENFNEDLGRAVLPTIKTLLGY
jgi:hypothetical protein